METKRVHLADLHFENKLWKTRLAFYQDELKIYEHRLQEISSHYTGMEIKKKVEHFQNQFYIQKNELVKLRQLIDREETTLSADVMSNPVASDHRLYEDHVNLRDQVEIYDKIYAELKKEYIRFSQETL